MSRRIKPSQMKICDTCPEHFKKRRVYCCELLRCCGQRVKGKCSLGKF